MASVTQQAGCQVAASNAAAAAVGGDVDHDGADAAAPAGKSQRLFGGLSWLSAASALTAA